MIGKVLIPSLKQTINAIFITILLVGCIWQVYEITFDYIEYEVLTSVGITVDRIKKAKSMIVCFHYFQVFDWEKFKARAWKYNFTLGKLDSYPNVFAFKQFFSNLTVLELLDTTYDDLITYGQYINENGKTNTTVFNVEKFVFDDDICYQVAPSFNFSFNKIKSHFTLAIPVIGQPDMNYYYYIAIPSLHIKNATSIVVSMNHKLKSGQMVHGKVKEPFLELLYTDRTVLNSSEGYMSVTSNTITYKKLAYPYTDQCVEYTCGHQINCFLDCMNEKTMEKFGLLSPLALHWKPSMRNGENWNKTMNELKDLNRRKLDGMTLGLSNNDRIIHSQFIDYCMEKYKNDDCINKVTITSSNLIQFKNGLFLIRNVYTSKPSYRIFSSPKIRFVDLIVYIFGTLGIWFGFSFLAIPGVLVNVLKMFEKENT